MTVMVHIFVCEIWFLHFFFLQGLERCQSRSSTGRSDVSVVLFDVKI